MSRTVSVNVDVDVDMRDIDTYNLVEELSKRYYRLLLNREGRLTISFKWICTRKLRPQNEI